MECTISERHKDYNSHLQHIDKYPLRAPADFESSDKAECKQGRVGKTEQGEKPAPTLSLSLRCQPRCDEKNGR